MIRRPTRSPLFPYTTLSRSKKHTTTAYVTFVAIDEHTRLPKPVPPLIVNTEEEKKRFREAGKRRKLRIPRRKRRGSAKRSEEHTSELQSQSNLVCRLLLDKT